VVGRYWLRRSVFLPARRSAPVASSRDRDARRNATTGTLGHSAGADGRRGRASATSYETIGTYFGYAIAQYADHYELRNLLLLGRVSSGAGGEAIVAKANEVLALEFPDLHKRIGITSPDESMKRHGQAIAAASLPDIRNGKQGASC